MTATGTCPTPSALEAFAAGTSADKAVAAHVGACAACRAVVAEISENDHFLSGVRTALAHFGTAGPASEKGASPVELDLVSGYEIQEELHRGGQGVVYRAVQRRTRRTVAIKMLLVDRGDSQRAKERFEREIRMAASLRHPNIVTVHDSGYIGDGRYGLVMEYIEGVPLDRWSRSLDAASGRDARRRTLRDRLGVMAKVCDAVLCAHQHSIVHRDLKPANIIVDAAGEPHVLDFGIARDIGTEQHTRLTHTGEFAGTLAYASPEQVSGDLSRVDTRTDIYSLGVILYEMGSGRMPYAVDGPMSEVLKGIESDEPVPPSRHTRDADGPWVDGEVSTIILKALAKDPARRYQTVAGLRNDINRYLAGEAIDARRDSTWYVLRKTAAKHRVLFSAAGVIFVMLAAFGAAMAWQAHRLDVRGQELVSALSDSTVERGRSLAAAGNCDQAEEVVWPELMSAEVTRIEGPEAGFVGSPAALHAYWALWDIHQTSSCEATFHTHRKQVGHLYFDETDRRLNAIDWSGTLFSWSVATDVPRGTWGPLRERNLVAAIDGVELTAAVAPGGNVAVFGGGLVRVIDPETGNVEAQLDDPDAEAASGAFSPDGSLLATIGHDSQLRLRDAHSLATVITIGENVFGACGGDVCWPTFSPDGSRIAAVRPDGTVGLWNTSSGVLERTLQVPDVVAGLTRGRSYAGPIAFGTDGTIAAALGGHVVVWPADGRASFDLGVPGGIILTLAFLPGSEGRRLVSSGGSIGNGGGLTIIWNLATADRVATFRQATVATACAASSDGRLIAMGADGESAVRVYNVVPDQHVRVLRAGGGTRGLLVAVSPDSRLVAITAPPLGENGRDLLLLDLASGATIDRIHCDTPGFHGLEFAPDGTLFQAEPNGQIRQLDVATGAVRQEFNVPEIASESPPEQHVKTDKDSYKFVLNQMRLSPDGSMLAQARNDGRIALWELPSGRWIDWLDGGVPELAAIDFSPDGRTLVAHDRKQLVLWDVQTRRPKPTPPAATYAARSVRFSPDGAVIARVIDGCMQFCDAATGRVIAEDKVFATSGSGMAFHPHGPIVFASALDASIRLWDSRTGRELLSLQKHTAPVVSLALTPDGNTLVSSDESGTVLAWDLTYYNGPIRREMEYRASHGAEP